MSANNNENGSVNVDFNSAVDAVMESIDWDRVLSDPELLALIDRMP